MLSRDGIARVLQDLIRAEVARLRPDVAADLAGSAWADDLPIGAGGLEADSLERLGLATAVNEMFHLHAAGIEDLLLARGRFGDWVDLVGRALNAGVAQVSFRSSGSTARPRGCVHNIRALAEEAADHAARLKPRRVLSAVPAHHIYGFVFAVLLPQVAMCPVLDIRTRLPSEFHVRDLIVSFPDHWRFLATALRPLPAVRGVTSAAPMPAALAADLLAGGLDGLTEIYGATETAGIAWRDSAQAPFRLLPGWTADGMRPDGTLTLRAADGRRVATPDRVEMTGADSFSLRGRLDGAVQVGGVNVYPSRVAATLERHPAVSQARVRLSAEERRLKALVVPREKSGSDATLQHDLLAWMARELSPPERPGRLTIVAALPKGTLGKDMDWDV